MRPATRACPQSLASDQSVSLASTSRTRARPRAPLPRGQGPPCRPHGSHARRCHPRALCARAMPRTPAPHRRRVLGHGAPHRFPTAHSAAASSQRAQHGCSRLDLGVDETGYTGCLIGACYSASTTHQSVTRSSFSPSSCRQRRRPCPHLGHVLGRDLKVEHLGIGLDTFR